MRGGAIHFPRGPAAEFLLGAAPQWRIVEGVMLAVLTNTTTLLDTFGAYPAWVVAAVGTVVLAVGLWLAGHLLKWTLRVLIAVVLVGGFGATAWMLIHH